MLPNSFFYKKPAKTAAKQNILNPSYGSKILYDENNQSRGIVSDPLPAFKSLSIGGLPNSFHHSCLLPDEDFIGPKNTMDFGR